MTKGGLVQSDTILQPLGRALVTAFYAAAQALKLYPLENATTQKSLEELFNIVRKLLDREGAVDLKLVGDFLFLNDARLRLDLSDYLAFSHVAGMLNKHGIGEIEFGAALTKEDLAPLISLMLQDAPIAEPFVRFRDRLALSHAGNLRIEPSKGAEPEPELESEEAAKQAAKRTYFQSVQVAREVLTDTRLGKAVNLRRVKRAVQGIVDQVLNNETSIVGMTTLRDYDEYTFTHCVNVCIFSVVIGQKLGLTKLQLYELGLGALFHDIGKQRIDQNVVNKTTGLTDDEWYQMQQHPTEGLLSLFSMKGLTEMPYRAMLQAYEHHMKRDLTGYPKNKRPRNPTLFSRIVATADGFDAATSKRSYQNQPWPPDEVLREMRDNPQRGYDPLLVKAFINVTGVFPVGTLCILDTGEMGLVAARNPDPTKVHQPMIRLVSTALGVMIGEKITVDLAEIDPATGKPLRAILKTTDPDRYGIKVADYFV
jgi:HD-GYP domain-containing protein (c-di-GMP phosphodiesterase class II)